MAEGTLGLKGAEQSFIVKKHNHVNIIDFKENLQQESMKLQVSIAAILRKSKTITKFVRLDI